VTITWKIKNIEYIVAQGGYANVAKNVHWFVEYSDADGKYANCWGNQQLDVNNLDPVTFTDWDSLTEEQVIDWVQSSMNEDPEVDHIARIEEYLVQRAEEGMEQRGIGIPSHW